MPSSDRAKTKSGHSIPDSKHFYLGWTGVLLTILCICILLLSAVRAGGVNSGCQLWIADTTLLETSSPISKCVKLERATTAQQREKGLSGRTEMAYDRGMLFVFEREGEHCFWMKDMHFSLDMLWLDQDGKIIDIVQNARPESYPKTFCPDKPASYVIEVRAGVVNASKLKPGQFLEIAR